MPKQKREPRERVKVVVAGSRDFNDYTMLEKILNAELAPIIMRGALPVIVSGGARGADRLAELYARKHGLKFNEHEAKWHQHGVQAGYIRNEAMVKIADRAVIFWDEKSRGSAHTIRLCVEKGIPMMVIYYESGKFSTKNHELEEE